MVTPDVIDVELFDPDPFEVVLLPAGPPGPPGSSDVIDDSVTSPVETWSSAKIVDELGDAVDDLIEDDGTSLSLLYANAKV